MHKYILNTYILINIYDYSDKYIYTLKLKIKIKIDNLNNNKIPVE